MNKTKCLGILVDVKADIIIEGHGGTVLDFARDGELKARCQALYDRQQDNKTLFPRLREAYSGG